MKCSLNTPNHQFTKCGSPSTAGIRAIVYNCTTLIKETKHKKDKQNIQINNKPHLVLNTERCCQNYTICNCCLPLFSSSNFVCKNKSTALLLPWNTSLRRYKDIGFCKTSSRTIHRLWYQLISDGSTLN